jgi:hypothetical protein
MPETDVELVPRRPALHRQRLPAFVACVAAIVTAVALTAGPWGRVTLRAEDTGRLEVEMEPSGQVELAHVTTSSRAAYEEDSRAPARAALGEAVQRSSSELARVLAVLVALVAFAGWLRDLTPATWVLVASAALACLVTVVTLRDRVLGALGSEGAALGLGRADVEATVWGAVAVAGSAAAALAAGVAAGPRPVEVRRVRRVRRQPPVAADGEPPRPRRRRRRVAGEAAPRGPVAEPRGPLASGHDDAG